MTISANAAAIEQPVAVNGVDVDQVMGLIGNIQENKAFAETQFRVKNQWIDGGRNRSHIKGFYAVCREDDTRAEAFTLDNDEPAFLASGDTAPNPVEFVLHALAGCLTTTMAYHAAVRGIGIESIDSELEGDLDLRGIFGPSEDVRKGYHNVRVKMRVESEADVDQLRELAMFSPVYDMVSNSLPVDLVIEKA